MRIRRICVTINTFRLILVTFKEKIDVGGLCTAAPSLQKNKRKENKAFLGGAGGCTKANMLVALRGNLHGKGYMSKEAR